MALLEVPENIQIQTVNLGGLWHAYAYPPYGTAHAAFHACGMTERMAISKVQTEMRNVEAQQRWDTIWGISHE